MSNAVRDDPAVPGCYPDAHPKPGGPVPVTPEKEEPMAAHEILKFQFDDVLDPKTRDLDPETRDIDPETRDIDLDTPGPRP